MKECRFGLDPEHLDADLCKEIERIANGGSWNDACRLHYRFLWYQSKCRDITSERQKLTVERTDNDNDIDSNEIDLSGLDTVLESI